jgi:chromosome segregation ATPase
LLEQKNEQLLTQLDQAKQDHDTKVQELQQKNEQSKKAHHEHQTELQSLREKVQMLSSEKQQAQRKIQGLQKDLTSAKQKHLATFKEFLEAYESTKGL